MFPEKVKKKQKFMSFFFVRQHVPRHVEHHFTWEACRAVWSVVTRCHFGARVLPVVIFSHQCARVLAREARPVFLGNRVQLLGSTSFRAACRVRRLGKEGV